MVSRRHPMITPRVFAIAVACATFATVAATTRAARAGGFREFAPGELVALAPVLARGEIAAVRPGPGGAPEQTAILAHVGAPPDLVRDVVARPERWREFVPRLGELDVTPLGGGRSHVRWRVDLAISSTGGEFTIALRPDGAIAIDSPITR